jgi:hypothetical protein
MNEGIGRGGYRVLAGVFLAVGGLGLASLIFAKVRDSNPALVLGIALVALALAVLFVLSLRALMRGVGASAGPASPRPLDIDLPGRSLGANVIELGDDELASAVAGDGAASTSREPIPVQPNRNLGADTKGWPSRKGPSGVTRGEARARETGKPTQFQVVLPPRREPGAVAIPKTSLRAPTEPPTVLAREVSRNAKAPEGMAKGACGTCGATLLAPQVRPLKLRCPSCQKVTLLT